MRERLFINLIQNDHIKKMYYKITHEACKRLLDIVDNELLSPEQLPVSKYLEKNSVEVYR